MLPPCPTIVDSIGVAEGTMDFLKICLAVFVGFVLGAVLYNPHPAKAALSTITLIELKKGYNAPLQVGEIVGFACTSDACYIASK
jgi:hypothetical protein